MTPGYPACRPALGARPSIGLNISGPCKHRSRMISCLYPGSHGFFSFPWINRNHFKNLALEQGLIDRNCQVQANEALKDVRWYFRERPGIKEDKPFCKKITDDHDEHSSKDRYGYLVQVHLDIIYCNDDCQQHDNGKYYPDHQFPGIKCHAEYHD